MKTTQQVIQVIDKNEKIVATINDCKTIKGAISKMKKSSIAFQTGWKIRVEVEIL